MRDGAEERGALGAITARVGSVFDIAATENAAILAFDCGTDVEFGVRRIGQLTGGARFFDQFGVFHLASFG